jgi:hypothetical protein
LIFTQARTDGPTIIPAVISTTALGSFTRFTLAARMGAATAITLMISSPLKLTLLTDRTASGAEALVSP